MEGIQVKREPAEEMLTSDIDIEQHGIKLEPMEDHLDCSQENAVTEDSVETTEPFEEIFIPDTKVLSDQLDFLREQSAQASHELQQDAPKLKRKRPEIDGRKLKKHKCVQCKIYYSQPQMLVWHRKHCHGPDSIIKVLKPHILKPVSYQCSVCKLECSRTLWMIRHLHEQHQFTDLPFHCKTCKKPFIRTDDLRRHEAQCRNQRTVRPRRFFNLRCEQCGIKFAHAEMLSWHLENCHGPTAIVKVIRTEDKYSFHCGFCSSAFTGCYLAMQHLSRKHEIINFPFQCDVCEVKFHSKFRLIQHQETVCKNVHSNQKRKTVECNEILELSSFKLEPGSQLDPQDSDGTGSSSKVTKGTFLKNLKCVQCGERFFKPEILAWHTEHCHGSERSVNVLQLYGASKIKYQCVACRSVHLGMIQTIQHLRNEHQFEQLPYKCTNCSYSFLFSHSLKCHQNTCRKTVLSTSMSEESSNSSHKKDQVHPVLSASPLTPSRPETTADSKNLRHCEGGVNTEMSTSNAGNKCEASDSPVPPSILPPSLSDALKCDLCGLTYFYREMVTWHTENCHGKNPTHRVIKLGKKYKFQCSFCATQRNDVYEMMEHLVDKHQLEKLPYKCHSCDKQFMTRHKLLEHHESKTVVDPAKPVEYTEIYCHRPSDTDEYEVKFQPRKGQICYSRKYKA